MTLGHPPLWSFLSEEAEGGLKGCLQALPSFEGKDHSSLLFPWTSLPCCPPPSCPQPQTQPEPFCETDSDEEILEQILELPLQQFCSKKLFSIPEEEEEEDEEDEEKPGAGSSSRDPSPPESLSPGLDCDSTQPQGPGPCPLSPESSSAGDHLEDTAGLVGGSSWRRGSVSTEKPPNRKRSPDPREHCSRLLSNGGTQASGRPGPTRERGGSTVGEGPRGGPEAGGRGGLAPSQRCPRGRTPESGLASCLSPKCLEISIEYDSEDEQEAGGGGLNITSSCYLGDGEAWGTAPIGRSKGAVKANSGPNPYPRLPAWEKGEPERRGRSATGRTKEPASRVRAHSHPGQPPTCCRLAALLAAHQPLPFHAAASISRGGAGPPGSLTCLLPPTFHCFAASADRNWDAQYSVIISHQLPPGSPLPMG